MPEFMVWLEGSALGETMRTSGVWAYAVVNLAHILGIAALFGAILVLDLRLLGVGRSISLSAIAGPTLPVAATGFAVAALSGVCLLATQATEYLGNPFIYIKFAAIALGLCNVVALHALPTWKDRRTREPTSSERARLAMLGGTSLLCWLTAISAGRLIGYW